VRVAIVHLGALQPGGYPPDTRALASAVAGHGHEVTLVTDPGPRADGLTSAVTTIAPGAARALGHHDVVHLMGVLRPRQIAYLRRALPGRTPLVVSPLTQLSESHLRRSRLKKLPYVPLLRRAAARWQVALHGFSALELDESRRYLPARSSFVAPSGVFEPPDVRWSGDGGYMLFFGRNDVHQKGIDLLLDAYASYRAAGGRTPLVVAGQPWGSSESFLARRAGAGVRIVGPVQDSEKWTLLSRARSLFFLSRWDGPPRPIREAISIGCPAVVTPGTHMGDLVRQHDAGAGVAFDAAAVAAAMSASDDGATTARWAAGATRLAERLAWSRVAVDYLEGYGVAAKATR
jgi:glycosyltransferase involved in cell wall biosynthesis